MGVDRYPIIATISRGLLLFWLKKQRADARDAATAVAYGIVIREVNSGAFDA